MKTKEKVESKKGKKLKIILIKACPDGFFALSLQRSFKVHLG